MPVDAARSLTNLATLCALLVPTHVDSLLNACVSLTSCCLSCDYVLSVLTQAPPIAGISFELIVLRVGFARAFSSRLGPPSAPSSSSMTPVLRTPSGEHSVFPMRVQITHERTFINSDVDKDLDAESVESKRPTLGGRPDDSGEVV